MCKFKSTRQWEERDFSFHDHDDDVAKAKGRPSSGEEGDDLMKSRFCVAVFETFKILQGSEGMGAAKVLGHGHTWPLRHGIIDLQKVSTKRNQ